MRRGFCWRNVCALAVILGLVDRADAQSPPNYRSDSPSALMQTLKRAPESDRNAIAEAMIERRAEVLPTLRESVRSGDQSEKVLAAGMIAEMRDRGSLDALVLASADRDVVVRRRAATVLRILADGRARPRLRELLQSETDLGVLKSAIAALGRVGQRPDIANIAPFLDHDNASVRVTAAGALALLGDQRGLDLAIQATTDTDPEVQKNATYILGFFSAPAAGDRLRVILDDPLGAWKGYALIAQGQRLLATQSVAEQITTLDGLAHGRSRTLAEWAVDRLTDIGTADAINVLRKVRNRPTPVGRLAERRILVLGAQP